MALLSVLFLLLYFLFLNLEGGDNNNISVLVS